MGNENQILSGLETTQIEKLLTQNTSNIMNSSNEEYADLQQILIASLINDKQALVNAVIKGLSGDQYKKVWNEDIEFNEGSTLLTDLFDDELIRQIAQEEDNQVFDIEDYLGSLESEVEEMEEDSAKKDSMLYLISAIKGYLMFK